jgi:hypothetical protein
MWLQLVALVIYATVNVSLWASPITQIELFLVSVPLGLVYFWFIFRFYR